MLPEELPASSRSPRCSKSYRSLGARSIPGVSSAWLQSASSCPTARSASDGAPWILGWPLTRTKKRAEHGLVSRRQRLEDRRAQEPPARTRRPVGGRRQRVLQVVHDPCSGRQL